MVNQQRALLFDVHSRPTSWQRAATRIDRHVLGLVVGLLALLAMAGLLYLSQASMAAELRYVLREHQRDELKLHEALTALRCQIARGESITSLEERTGRLGLVDAPPGDPQVVCYVPAAVAVGAPAGAQVPAGPRPAPTFVEWLFSSLQ